jgi:hypothetical protein
VSQPRLSRWVVLTLALLGCGDPWMDPARAPQRTGVIVVPIPRGPNAPAAYRPEAVAAIARGARPDAIFLELPPAVFERVRAAPDGDRWTEVKPEVAPLIALAGELGATLEPVSGWTPAVLADWRAFIARGLPDDPLYRRARTYRLRKDEDEGDDLEWVFGPTRRRVVEWEARALEATVPDKLGAAAHSRVGAAHEAAVHEAIGRHEGERILIAIDARYASLAERAAARREARVVSPLAFEDALDAYEESLEE